MLKNKRISPVLAFILIITLMVSPLILARTPATDNIKKTFNDLNEAKYTWALEYIAYLYDLKVVQGNGKGQFLPDKEVKVNEYLKMLVVAITGETYVDTKQWDKPYIEKAIELGLIQKNEFNDYNTPINRYDMSKLIVRACDESYEDYTKYLNRFNDSISTEYKDFVFKAYSKGFIQGSNNKYNGNNTMLRSEATAVITRLIDPNQRLKVPPTQTTPGSSNPAISFNPETDVNDKGLMKYEKAREYITELRDNIVFYKENGKYYVKGTVPVLPEGFAFTYVIDIGLKKEAGPYYKTGLPAHPEDNLPQTGSFVKDMSLQNFSHPNEIFSMDIKIAVYTIEQQASQCGYGIHIVPDYPNETHSWYEDTTYDFPGSAPITYEEYKTKELSQLPGYKILFTK